MPAFFKTLEKIRPVYDWTYKILMFLCKLLLIADIIITAWAVAGRYIPFITDPHWSEEIILTLDDDPEADYEGIRRINALEWLIGKASI